MKIPHPQTRWHRVVAGLVLAVLAFGWPWAMKGAESPANPGATATVPGGNSTMATAHDQAPGDVIKQLRMVVRLASKKQILDGDSFDIMVTIQNISKKPVALGDGALDASSFDFDFRYLGDGKKIPVTRLALTKKGQEFYNQRPSNPGAPLILNAGQQRDYRFAVSQMYDLPAVGQAKMDTYMRSTTNPNHAGGVNIYAEDETSAAGKYQIVVHRLIPAQARAHDATTTSDATKPGSNDLISAPLPITIAPSNVKPAMPRTKPSAWWSNTSY